MGADSGMECRWDPKLSLEELAAAAEKYHFWASADGSGPAEPERFREKQEEFVRRLWERLQEAADCRAVCVPEKGRREAYAVLSLGARVDGLQELYCRKGLLTEAYLTDCLCRELLRGGCRQLNGLLADRFGLYAQRYLFPGEQLPLSSMETIFSRLRENGEEPPARLLPGGVLLPRQSVACVIRLSESPETVCAGFCGDCSRRGSCGAQSGSREKTDRRE